VLQQRAPGGFRVAVGEVGVGGWIRAFAIWLLAGGAVGCADLAAAEPTRPELEARFSELVDRSRQQPANLDVLYDLATVAVALGDYESAISAFERMLIFNPDLPRVRLELGVLYYRLGAYEVARLQFEKAVAGPDVPQEVRDRVADYLAGIDQRQAPDVVTGSLTVGLRTQTNPAASSGPTDVRIGDLVFRTDQDRTSDQSTFAFGVLRHVHRFESQWDDEVETNAAVYGEAYRRLDDLDVFLIEVDSGPRFGLGRFGLQDLAVRPFATLGDVSLDDSLFYRWGGAGLELRWDLSPSLRWETSGRSRRLYYGNSGDRDLTDRSGWRHEGRTGLQYVPRAADRYDLYLYMDRATAREDYRAYREFGLVAFLSHRFALPAWVGLPSLTAYFGGSLATARYDSRDPLIESQQRRIDRSFGLRGGLSLALTDQLSLLAELQRREVYSSIGLYRYDNTGATLGLRFTF